MVSVRFGTGTHSASYHTDSSPAPACRRTVVRTSQSVPSVITSG